MAHYNCVYCQAPIRRYKLCLNKSMAEYLTKLYLAGGEAETCELNLTRSQYTNYTKLRHWGLITPVLETEEQKAKWGKWRLTLLGTQFILNSISLPKSLYTVKGKFDGFYLDDGAIAMADLMPEPWRVKADYATDCELLPKSEQTFLFKQNSPILSSIMNLFKKMKLVNSESEIR